MSLNKLTMMVIVTALALSVTIGAPLRAYGATSTALSATEYEEFIKLLEASKTGKYPDKNKDVTASGMVNQVVTTNNTQTSSGAQKAPPMPPPQYPGLPIPSSRLQGDLRFDPHIQEFELHFRKSAQYRTWSLLLSLAGPTVAYLMIKDRPSRARTAFGVTIGFGVVSLGCYVASLMEDFLAANAIFGERPTTPKPHINWQTGGTY